jgi:hypothetical protein
MFWRVSARAVPFFLLILSSLWTAATYAPLVYSLAFPNHLIQRIISHLRNPNPTNSDLSPLRGLIDNAGHLKHAIRVGAYYGAATEYESRQWHNSKRTEFTYVAWFEKPPNPRVMVVKVTQSDSSTLHYEIYEGQKFVMVRVLLLPLLAVAVCAYWLRRAFRARPTLEPAISS